MAANVSSFNAVWTYDIWQDYIRPGRPDSYYLRVGRITTVVGVFIGIGTAFIASGYNNISNYFQTLFSFFNVPIFVAFIVGMFWRKAGRGSGFWGLIVGVALSFGTWVLYKQHVISFRSDLNENQWGAIIGFTGGVLAMVIATRFSPPKPHLRAARPGLGARRTRYRGRRSRALVQVSGAARHRCARLERGVCTCTSTWYREGCG